MSDFEKGRQTGLGGGWDPHGDIAGQLEGQRQREQAQAADRNRNNGGWNGGGGGQEGGAGIVLLMAVVGVGVLIFTYRVLLASLVFGVLVAAALVFATRKVTGNAGTVWGALRAAALAHAVAIGAVVACLLVSALLNRFGVRLTPGLELFTDYGVVTTGLQSIVLPVIAWTAAGAWWLNRGQQGSAAIRGLSWGAGVLTMIASPWLGLKLALATFALF